MIELVKLSCRISSTNPGSALGLEIWLDQDQIFNTEHVQDPVDFEHEFDDNEGQHDLRFILKNKTAEHTTIDADGTILTDSCICISDLCFDQINLGQIFTDHAVYEHDFNGTADTIKDQFFGTMGCNGTVSLAFSTPIYLWLLENM
jgi:hypothetical protein